MNQEEAVGFYHSLERFGIRPGLERIGALCERLDNPQNRFRCVHVAGTNGKGSTCTEIASILTESGYQTGLYTSPYVIDFRERIRFNGEMIGGEELASVTADVKAAVEELAKEGITITEFEAVTAAAFLYYDRCGCEIAVLETGLGGRFDATNIITDPLCCVITSISFDHTGILGDTLAAIAAEKCGIIKPDIDVVTSSMLVPDALAVVRVQAQQKNAMLHLADPNSLKILSENITGTLVESGGVRFKIPFPGRHQLENASLALEAINILRRKGYAVTDEQLAAGFEKSRIPARTELISRQPDVILDGSHNDGSTAALAQALRRFYPGKRILSVMGMMADKDCRKALENLMPLFAKVIAVTPSNKRSMPAAEFCRLIAGFGVETEAFDDPTEGVAEAFRQSDGYDLIVICGSLYLAADVREYILNRRESIIY